MNLRNKWAVGTVRILLGLLFLGMGAWGLYFIVSGNIPEVPGATEATRLAEAGLAAAGLTYVVKVIEVVAALMLLFNFRPALAALLLAPIVVGIMVYDLALWLHVPASLIPAVFALLGTAYLGYVHWDRYAAIFAK